MLRRLRCCCRSRAVAIHNNDRGPAGFCMEWVTDTCCVREGRLSADSPPLPARRQEAAAWAGEERRTRLSWCRCLRAQTGRETEPPCTSGCPPTTADWGFALFFFFLSPKQSSFLEFLLHKKWSFFLMKHNFTGKR